MILGIVYKRFLYLSVCSRKNVLTERGRIDAFVPNDVLTAVYMMCTVGCVFSTRRLTEPDM